MITPEARRDAERYKSAYHAKRAFHTGKVPKVAPTTVSPWRSFARPKQIAPEGDWRVWLVQAGRGFGKTRVGAEWICEQIQAGKRRLALVAPIAADCRDVMVEGESGILAVCSGEVKGPDGKAVGVKHPIGMPLYEPSKRRLTWPNGAIATTYSGEEPERLRGPQHDSAWCDEIGAWKYPTDVWDMLMFGLRLGDNPRVCATTTPRPIQLIRDLLKAPSTIVVRGATSENAENLAPQFLEQIVGKYKDTRLGRQELEGELLDDVPGALWQRAQLDALRVDAAPELIRVVVAIDPAMTSGEKADETGIVAAGKGVDDHWYVLADRSCRDTPDGWGRRAVGLHKEMTGDRIVAEVNNGGEMVEHVLRTIDSEIPYKAVHASRGKRVRAEPIAALYEQGKVHHVGGFTALEDQMCNFVPDDYDGSPDRVDALVWALTELSGGYQFICL